MLLLVLYLNIIIGAIMKYYCWHFVEHGDMGENTLWGVALGKKTIYFFWYILYYFGGSFL
jgi:hypothetical protein